MAKNVTSHQEFVLCFLQKLRQAPCQMWKMVDQLQSIVMAYPAASIGKW
jgi:hypothetical protein